MKQEHRFGGSLSSRKRVPDIPAKNQEYHFEDLPTYRDTALSNPVLNQERSL